MAKKMTDTTRSEAILCAVVQMTAKNDLSANLAKAGVLLERAAQRAKAA